ncbi:hypothetical protein G7046_g5630 [Stylonectria norvegica]|nr:hypothetical protein G7046_g5630 [Stylonectria norvegica]
MRCAALGLGLKLQATAAHHVDSLDEQDEKGSALSCFFLFVVVCIFTGVCSVSSVSGIFSVSSVFSISRSLRSTTSSLPTSLINTILTDGLAHSLDIARELRKIAPNRPSPAARLVVQMGTDIASRLKAKFSRRRHSTAPSLASNPSAADTSSIRSHYREREHEEHEHEHEPERHHSSSLRAVSQTRTSTPLAASSQRTPSQKATSQQGGDGGNDGDGDDTASHHHGDHHGGVAVDLSLNRGRGEEGVERQDQEQVPLSIPSSLRAPAAGVQHHQQTAVTDAAPAATVATNLETAPPVPLQGLQLSSALPLPVTAPLITIGHLDAATAASDTPIDDDPSLYPHSSWHPLHTHPSLEAPPLSPTHPQLTNLDSINEDSSAERSPATSPVTSPIPSPVDAPLPLPTPLPSDPDAIDHDHKPDKDPIPTRDNDKYHDAPRDDQHNALILTPVPPATPGATPGASSWAALLPGLPTPTSLSSRPAAPPRRQSLLSNRQTTLIQTLLHTSPPNESGIEAAVLPIEADMVTRKVWVRRPHASPTLITVNEDDLVDDVRDMILRKYANSLGRTFDSPDLNIRVIPRDQNKERMLGPEEPMGRTLDAYYPGGQNVDEALIIDIPRRGPKASPRPVQPYAPHVANIYYNEDGRPSENAEGYFPNVGGVPSPHLPVTIPVQTNGPGQHSIAILGTGHLPPIPSPGGTRSRAYRDRPDRPRLGRTHTSSPTIIANGVTGFKAAAVGHGTHGTQHVNPRLSRSRTHSNSSDPSGMPPTAPSIPSPPAIEPSQARTSTPPPRLTSPRPSSSRPKKKKNAEHPSLPPGMLNGSVPPISVLIVEDNPINLKLLEAFVKRLKVRWQTAMNGRDAVKKWRSGGFHLVLMDIQLPIMNGLDATREIRRLEKVNSIGVFSQSPTSNFPEESDELKEQDRLDNASLFKSPVIIVALTASSLQSDRHEALAAGCNDFLTKPVNFVWLERKVMEWGCMQALIDFDGWRKWKDFSHEADENEGNKKMAASRAKQKKIRASMA